jgi:hypothetical protein
MMDRFGHDRTSSGLNCRSFGRFISIRSPVHCHHTDIIWSLARHYPVLKHGSEKSLAQIVRRLLVCVNSLVSMTKTIQFASMVLALTSVVSADERPPQQHRLSPPVITPPETPLPYMRLSDPELDAAKGLLIAYHPSSAVVLGTGVNATDLTDVKDRPLVLSPLKRVGWTDKDLGKIPRLTDGFQTDSGVRQVSFRAELVRNRQELYRALNISMSAEADGWFASGSASMSLATSRSFSSDSVTLVIKADCDYGRYALESIVLTPEAQRIANDEKLFYRRYGTHVAVMEDRFSEMAAVITIQADSDTTASSLSESMQGDIDLFVVSGSVSQSLSKQTKDLIAKTHITVEFFAIGGEGIGKLGAILKSVTGVDSNDPNKVLGLLDQAKDAVRAYMDTFSGDAAPARTYWCFPLATLRRSNPVVQDLQQILARRERAAEGIIELQQIADQGLGLRTSDATGKPLPDGDPHLIAIRTADQAARERANDMLHFFRSTFVMSTGTFIKEAKDQSVKAQTRFDELRAALNIAGRITPLVKAKTSPAWELSLYDEWQYWMAGVTEFPFVEKARAAAAANPTVRLDTKLEIRALSTQ